MADAVLARRSSDDATATPPVFTPGTGPGEYQLTPPAFAPAGLTQTAHVTPFVLNNASQFRPAPPPALTSPRYAADFSELHALGELNSATRTADQTAIGRFWGAAPIWIVWNEIADQAGAGFGNSNDPSYPGAHATFSQAAASVLEDFFGTDVFSFSLTAGSAAPARSSRASQERPMRRPASRIFAGQHFRYDEEAGQTLGNQVADFVLDHALLPTDHHRR